tara:strand:- start:661 stop:1032 length:372 start_codon:yes stop_codon:yes gene_type:complete
MFRLQMIDNGMPWSQIEAIPTSYVNDYYMLMQHGIVGYAKDAQQLNYDYISSHNTQQAIYAANVPKFKPKDAQPLERVLPSFNLLLHGHKEKKKPDPFKMAYQMFANSTTNPELKRRFEDDTD